MSKKTVEFFYDVVSPYTWFAFEVLCRYQHRWNITLKLRPFYLGAIMHDSGNRPPAMVPNKGTYMLKDVPRCAKYFDVPLKFPKNVPEMMFVKGSLSAQRFLTAVEMNKPQMLEKVSRELWMRNWSRDEDITEAKSFTEAAQNAGMSDQDIAAFLPLIKDESVKNRLKATTKEAYDLGAFGSPMIVTEVDGKKEWVFGSDRFPLFAELIGEKWEGPVPGVSSKL
ncbi:glutathione-S-transferase kappa 1 [Biomphalaria pfeifferi]|uniref:Glutathione S-transferase kappa n=1 Tax=Biomphalaria pfeifferi TaxID=112525 RepID=A0AAD8BWV5_BIOPF|nr:glutathione-S-transferase kappa 1 [Biomphalaria pfeifferi]